MIATVCNYVETIPSERIIFEERRMVDKKIILVVKNKD